MVSINSEMLQSMLRHPPRRAATIIASMPPQSSPWGQSRAIWTSEIRPPPALGKNPPPAGRPAWRSAWRPAWRLSVNSSSSMASRCPSVVAPSSLIPTPVHSHGFEAMRRKKRHATATAKSSDLNEATGGDRPGSDPKPQYEAPPWLQRTQLLVGDEGLKRLDRSRVLLVGLGGVGSYAAEFLVRAGIGHLTIVDGDVVDLSNKNRQLPALDSTVGLHKVDVVARRLLDINPDLDLLSLNQFLDPESAASLVRGEHPAKSVSHDIHLGTKDSSTSTSPSGSEILSDLKTTGYVGSPSMGERRRLDASSEETLDATGLSTAPVNSHAGDDLGALQQIPFSRPYDYVIDCIDSIAPKLMLLRSAKEAGIRVISSMGAGGRLDPSRVRVGDLWDTHGDPFSALIRKRLRKADRDEQQREAPDEDQGSVGEVGSTTVARGAQEEHQEGSSSSRRGGRHDSERGTSGRSGIVVVWTDEPVAPASLALTEQRYKKSFYGTISYIPAIFGLYISSHVIRELLGTPLEALLAPPDENPPLMMKHSKQQKQQRQRGEAASDPHQAPTPKKMPRLRPSRGREATRDPIEGVTGHPGEGVGSGGHGATGKFTADQVQSIAIKGPMLSSEGLINLHSKEGEGVLKDSSSSTLALAVQGEEGYFVGLGL